MESGVESRLARIADRAEIAEVVHAYAHAIDRNDHVLLMSCFYPDATFQFQDGPPVAVPDFFAASGGQADGLRSTSHHISNQMIVFDGEEADSQVYLQAYHLVGADAPDRLPLFPATGEAYGVLIGGRYVDRFARRDHRWRIVRRALYFDWHFNVTGPEIPMLPLDMRDGGFGAALRRARA